MSRNKGTFLTNQKLKDLVLNWGLGKAGILHSFQRLYRVRGLYMVIYANPSKLSSLSLGFGDL